MFMLSYHINKRHFASLFSALFFTFNPWILTEYLKGHYELCLGYSLSPLLFLAYDRAFLKKDLGNIGLAAFITSLFFGSQMQHTLYIFGVMIGIFVLMQFLICLNKIRSLLKTTKTFAITLILITCLTANWLVPYFLKVEPNLYFGFYWNLEQIYVYSCKSTLDAIALQGFSGELAQNMVFPALPFPIEYLIIIFPFLLAFSSLFIKKNRYVFFFTITAIVSIFIAKGPYPPFGEVFIFLYNTVPGFNTFRVAAKWLMMTSFSYAVLIGISIAHFERVLSFKLGQYLRINNLDKIRKRCFRVFFNSFMTALIVALIVLYVWAGFFISFPRTFEIPDQYVAPYQFIDQQLGDYRIATLPFNVPWVHAQEWGMTRDFSYYSPAITGKSVVYYFPEDMGAFPPALDFLGFIDQWMIRQERTDDVLKILGPVASVRYVVSQHHAPDFERDFLLMQDGGQVVYTYPKGKAMVLENNYWQPYLYATSSYAIVVGGLEAFTSLTDIEGFNLRDFPLIFSEQIRTSSEYLTLLKASSVIIFSDTDFLDFAMQLMPPEKAYIIQAAKFGSLYSNPEQHWVKSYRWTRYEGKLVFNRLTLSTSKTNNRIDIPFKVSSNRPYEVWIHLANKGKLSIGIDDIIVLDNVQQSPELHSGFSWLNVGSFDLNQGRHVINLMNREGPVDIDEIVIIPPEALKEHLGATEKLLRNLPGRFVSILEAENSFVGKAAQGWLPLHIWNASNGYVLHSHDIGETEKQIFIPKTGEYSIVVKSIGNLSIQIDGAAYFSIKSDGDPYNKLNEHQIGPLLLDAGYHRITVSGSNAYLDKMILFSQQPDESHISLKEVFKVEAPPVHSYTKLDSTKYHLHIKAEKPFFLVLTEAYDPLWKANIGNEQLESITTNHFSNGFYVTKTGEYDITVEYQGQRILYVGWAISIVTFTSLIVYLAIWRKRERVARLTSLLHRVRRLIHFPLRGKNEAE